MRPRRSARVMVFDPMGRVLLIRCEVVRRDGKLFVFWLTAGGEIEQDEEPLAAARREFAEELGSPPPEGTPIDLGQVRQRSGKIVTAWGLHGDFDASTIVSNTCMVQWPARSGRQIEIPEVDRAEWFGMASAREKINPAQVALLDRLHSAVAQGSAA